MICGGVAMLGMMQVLRLLLGAFFYMITHP
jgi:hypothetical protein